MKTDGTLRKLPSGQWAIQAPGREPVPIVAGEIFLLEGKRVLRIEHREGQWYVIGRRVELRDGMRAGFYDRRE